jgi:hypothetical protein
LKLQRIYHQMSNCDLVKLTSSLCDELELSL